MAFLGKACGYGLQQRSNQAITTDSWPPPEGAEPGKSGLKWADACQLNTGVPILDPADNGSGHYINERMRRKESVSTTLRKTPLLLVTLWLLAMAVGVMALVATAGTARAGTGPSVQPTVKSGNPTCKTLLSPPTGLRDKDRSAHVGDLRPGNGHLP